MASDDDKKLRGAIIGGLTGGGLTGGAILSTKAGRKAFKNSAGKMYQRQLYGVTGKFGKNVGSSEAEQLAHAKKIGLVPKKVNPSSEQFARLKEGPSVFERAKAGVLGRGAEGSRAKAIRKAQEFQHAQQRAFSKGHMSVPGVVHGLMTNPKSVIKGSWKRGGTAGKVFAGLGAYETGKGLIEKPKEGGPGRLESGLRGAGSTLGWMVAPHTILAGQMVGSAGGYLGGKVGKLGDRATGRAVGRKVIQQGPANYRSA
jgi:hypothetical protein